MKASSYKVYPLGSPERVIAHAQYKESRGKGPSMGFLTERNPRKALADARRFVADKSRKQPIESAIVRIGGILLAGPKKDYRRLEEPMVIAAMHAIVSTSSSAEEIKLRAKSELGYPYSALSVDILKGEDQKSVEALELCKGLGGLCMKTGWIAQLMMCGPDGSMLML